MGPSFTYLPLPPGSGNEGGSDRMDRQPQKGRQRNCRKAISLGQPGPAPPSTPSWTGGHGPLLGPHGSLSLACPLRTGHLGSWEVFRWVVNGASPRSPEASQETREGTGDVFCFWVPWGPRGRLKQAPCREGVNKQQVIKHDKR